MCYHYRRLGGAIWEIPACWRLANRFGLRYRPVIGRLGDYDQHDWVDVNAVLAALDEV